ncbi:MAG: TIR domain-containing protein [Acidobacteria bacterium]|nr:TIR domain-containing protein [Acidobacteriota bacterium]
MSENPQSSQPLRVFLCHSSGDKKSVRALHQRLREDGIEPWLDEENILPGQDWEHEITKAVRTADAVIVCLSRESITKTGYVQKEIRFALDKADEQPEGVIFIIPLKLEQCDVPDRLRRWHWVNYFEAQGYERLLRALRSRAAKLDVPAAFSPDGAAYNNLAAKAFSEDLPNRPTSLLQPTSLISTEAHTPQSSENPVASTTNASGAEPAIMVAPQTATKPPMAQIQNALRLSSRPTHDASLLASPSGMTDARKAGWLRQHKVTLGSLSVIAILALVIWAIFYRNVRIQQPVLTEEHASESLNTNQSEASQPSHALISKPSGEPVTSFNQTPLTLTRHNGTALTVAFSPDGTMLASGGDGKTIELWDTQTGKLKQTIETDAWVVAFSPDGTMLASGGDDRTVKLWDVQTGTLKRTLSGHRRFVLAIAFSPDGSMLASGSDDRTVKLWDVQTGQLRQTLTGHREQVGGVAFSPDGKILATGSVDATIKLWDVQTGQLKQTLTGHRDNVNDVAFSPDGTMLASGGDDRTVKLWDVQTGQLKQTLTGHSKSVAAIAFSPDGSMLASGSDDRTVKLWDVQTGQLRQTLTGHHQWIWALAFSPDGKMLASGSFDSTIKLWKAKP